MAGGGHARTPASSSSSSRQWKPRAPREQGRERSSECQKEGPTSSSPSVSRKKSPPPMAGGGDVRTPASSSSWQRKPHAPPEQGNQRSVECQKEGPCSSSPSVKSKTSPLQMGTLVEPPKSLNSPLQTVTSVGPPKSLDSLQLTVTSVEPPKSLYSQQQMVTPVEPPKSLDSTSTLCGSGSLGSDSGAEPFDICIDNSNGSFKLKPSLLQSNREKRRTDSVAPLQRLRPGMVLLKNFLKLDDQVKIIQHCRRLGVGTGGFYTPGYRDGAKLNLRMMCLGKNWDPDSSSYGDKRLFDGAQPPNIPEVLTMFVKDALEASRKFLIQKFGEASDPSVELPLMSPDICIVNFYTETGRLGLHQDKDEAEASLIKGLPVVSFSLGNTAEFLYGDERDDNKASKVDLESGDVLIFGGQSRHIFHGVSKIKPKTAPGTLAVRTNLQPGRLNLTFRQYQ